MKHIAVSFVSVVLFGGAFACGMGNVSLGDNEYQLQKTATGGSTGNGQTCSWGAASNVGSTSGTDAVQYDVGASVPSPSSCNTCVCTTSGIACTKRACPAVCNVQGKGYAVGDTWMESCNSCRCDPDGKAVCTKISCSATVCKYNGKEYRSGDTFKDVDGCNDCTCGAGGAIACTERACLVPTCKYNGKTFNAGDQYPDVDCCNMCTCQTDGTSACGAALCGPGGGTLCK